MTKGFVAYKNGIEVLLPKSGVIITESCRNKREPESESQLEEKKMPAEV